MEPRNALEHRSANLQVTGLDASRREDLLGTSARPPLSPDFARILDLELSETGNIGPEKGGPFSPDDQATSPTVVLEETFSALKSLPSSRNISDEAEVLHIESNVNYPMVTL